LTDVAEQTGEIIMRKIVEEYLKKPNAALLAKMTSEEQRFVKRQEKKKDSKGEK
jgi:hypothetical protein